MYVIVLFANRKDLTLSLQYTKMIRSAAGEQGGKVMIDKTKIKIVKRTDAVVKGSAKKKAPTARASARDMVSTVTEWVSDLKDRKREETKAAFDLLFVANRQPNES